LNDLIDEKEVAELARQYGPLERRHYVLECTPRTFILREFTASPQAA